MLSLITFFWYSLPTWSRLSTTRLFFFALVCCLLGDILLLFPALNALGILSFATGLILYSFCFWRTGGFHWFDDRWIYAGMLTLFIFVLAMTLWPLLSGFILLSVLFYIFVISLFSLFAYARAKRTPGYFLVWIGSFLFIFSSTIFATQTFFTSFFIGNALLILIYIVAQYLIVRGMLIYFKSTSSES